jgi:tetratricopeptide (TPR) repeat protein
MKKTINLILSVTVMTLLMTVSCTEDFLETDPIGKAAVDNFYETDRDARMALMAAYDILQWKHASGSWNSTYLVKELPSDDVNAGGGGEGDQPRLQRIDNFEYGPDNDAISFVYQSDYYGIYRANKVINNTKPESEMRKQIIAEAKFLRAYYYFELVSMFGDVPLNLEDLAPSEYSQPRTPAEEVYVQIEKDLGEAIANLPLKSEYSERDRFRATKGAARALLGKAHLYQEEWDKAAGYFDEVIQSGEYSLVDDYSTLFTKAQEFGKESLFEVSYTTQEQYNWGNFPWGARSEEANIVIQLMGRRWNQNFDPGNTGLTAGWGFLPATPEIYAAYPDKDLRRSASVMTEDTLEAKGGSMGEGYEYEGYIKIKYHPRTNETTTEGGAVGSLNFGTNLRLIRYADVLLMAAEAYYQSGNEDRALTELNKVRERAGLNDVSASGQDLFNAIVKERRIELAFEGHRFLDLVRWGRAEEELSDRGYVEGKHNLYPIPLNEVRNNKQIENNNPGY